MTHFGWCIWIEKSTFKKISLSLKKNLESILCLRIKIECNDLRVTLYISVFVYFSIISAYNLYHIILNKITTLAACRLLPSSRLSVRANSV